jgi:hypothetical protein
MSRSYTSYPPKRSYGVQWDCFTFTQFHLLERPNMNDWNKVQKHWVPFGAKEKIVTVI